MLYLIRKIFGVDFSGSKKACEKIWVSEGSVYGNFLKIHTCRPAHFFSESHDAQSCIAALYSMIAREKHAIFGMDFPFALPSSLTEENNWKDFIINFPFKHESAESFRDYYRHKTYGKEFKRKKEDEKGAPFAAYNLWLYKQTYHGISRIINPLVRNNLACILPIQPPNPEKPWVIEICPACTLKEKDLYVPYKGKKSDRETNRKSIVDKLEEFNILLDDEIKDICISNTRGDALDSILAAYAVFRNMQSLKEKNLDELERREGDVYY
ncbi:hypothetical protein [Methanohalophilus sp. DAL1]|uniref:hypothetical protein n=1 Tax=Methanohalophilus sp. DAL1 TaxID=1864608 RepID=UPI0008173076|nr:hypothetical protein [Methanohalophilus sp. DAL1]OBZ35335.1 MAG: hypothetical protein A9957_07675 [Methanohalophilus sp. DAL1]